VIFLFQPPRHGAGTRRRRTAFHLLLSFFSSPKAPIFFYRMRKEIEVLEPLNFFPFPPLEHRTSLLFFSFFLFFVLGVSVEDPSVPFFLRTTLFFPPDRLPQKDKRRFFPSSPLPLASYGQRGDPFSKISFLFSPKWVGQQTTPLSPPLPPQSRFFPLPPGREKVFPLDAVSLAARPLGLQACPPFFWRRNGSPFSVPAKLGEHQFSFFFFFLFLFHGNVQ